jgi:hypothetical protein
MSSEPMEVDDSHERRSETRFLCEGEAHIFDSSTGMELGEGIISDISPSGASLHVYCPLTPGTIIELQQGDVLYHGEIRYCISSGADFRLGIQLIPPDQWTPARTWPQLRRK